MDDGGYDSLGGFKFFTNSYTKTEVELLVSVLESKFNIKGKIGQISQNYIIRIGRAEYPKLREIVLPYIHSSMLYKFPSP